MTFVVPRLFFPTVMKKHEATSARERLLEVTAKKISRAVLLDIKESVNDAVAEECAGCDERIIFMAAGQAEKYGRPVVAVVCNLYDKSHNWTGKEIWHEDCYAEAGEPYGDVIDISRQGSQLPTA